MVQKQTRSRDVEQSGETPVPAEPGVALGNKASLKSDRTDRQLVQFARPLISIPPYTTFSICVWTTRRLQRMIPQLNSVQIGTSARPQEQIFLLSWSSLCVCKSSPVGGAPLMVSEGWRKRYWWNEPLNIHYPSKNSAFPAGMQRFSITVGRCIYDLYPRPPSILMCVEAELVCACVCLWIHSKFTVFLFVAQRWESLWYLVPQDHLVLMPLF